MSERRPATTIGELDIHLGNVMETLTELKTSSKQMQQTLSTLATQAYVDDQVRMVKESIHQAKPSTQIGNLAKIVGSILVLITFCGFMFEAVVFLQHVRQSLPATVTTAKP